MEGNEWKMNKSVAASVSFVNQIIDPLSKINSVTTVICPPFTSLSELTKSIAGTRIKLGAQNVYFEFDGAWGGLSYNVCLLTANIAVSCPAYFC